MRYLNKIVFINSAAIPYAEIQLDGNIHFIGTQGVGKSTILRAILFFYNADSRKLGMPKGGASKSFADWYLAYGNSFMIYEVKRETGAYCVLAFKSQNRVCFRFIDSAYDSSFFMSESGDVYSSWEAIRAQLDAKRVNVSSIINKYEEYRDILYGKFIGKTEFKKYALLEAKQYNNIFRTIQNVFLNTKLDAAEIKQTIISSMEDESSVIDLDRYSHHLKGFETSLNDIRRFRFPSVSRQAQEAIQMMSAIRHIDREQSRKSAALKGRLYLIEKEKPLSEAKQAKYQHSLALLNQKKQQEYLLFEKRKEKISDISSQLSGKIKDSVKRRAYYQNLNISELINRVAANNEKKLEQKSLHQEYQILTNNFSDIKHKYEVLISEKENQLAAYLNHKEKEHVGLEKEGLSFVGRLNHEYEQLFETLEHDYEADLVAKTTAVSFKVDELQALEKKMLSVKYQSFFAEELELTKQVTEVSNLELQEDTSNIVSYQQQIENLQTKWEYEKKVLEQQKQDELEKLQQVLKDNQQVKASLEEKINNSQNSFYGWLNQNKPDWEATIGKVVDDHLLFKAGLSPKLNDDATSFYGVNLQLGDIKATVKTMADYRFDLTNIEQQLDLGQQQIQVHASILVEEFAKIQRRNLPKIKELKELKRQAEYNCDQLKRVIEKAVLDQENLTTKATEEKRKVAAALQIELDQAVVGKQDAIAGLEVIKSQLKQKKENKLREKNKRLKENKNTNQAQQVLLDQQIASRENEIAAVLDELRNKRNAELHDKGGDTKRLSEIEQQLTMLENELAYIDQHRDTVSEFKKDKRELFDKEKQFKNDLQLLEEKLKQLKADFDGIINKLVSKIVSIEQEIRVIADRITGFELDEDTYEKFKLSDAYLSLETYISTNEAISGNLTGIQLIEDLKEKFYQKKDKIDELKINVDKFLSHFSEGNVFKFPAKLIATEKYLEWVKELNDFIEENKIDEYEKRSNERFASIVNSVGKETTMLVSKTGDLKKVIKKINNDFKQKNFVTAVNSIELDITDSKNTAVLLLKKIKEFNDDHAVDLGAMNLFSGEDHHKNNEKAVGLLKQLVKEINQAKTTEIHLSDSFELSFRIEENGNDTGWVEKLSNVGSEGTDVLVKAMINIMLLNVFKEGASRKFKDFKLHCMMDEIGKLHPTNVKGILKFANDRNIMLINGSPTESTPLSYRHIYKIHKDENRQSRIKRIISNAHIN